MTSMFEKCTGLTSLDISTFHPTMNEQYTKMFYGCSNLEYVNFYNYYENENTIFNDIITNAHPNIILCIHVKREARIYLSYPEHLDIECLRPDIDRSNNNYYYYNDTNKKRNYYNNNSCSNKNSNNYNHYNNTN